MNCILVLACAVLGAVSASVVGPVGVGNIGGMFGGVVGGPAPVFETVVTPFRRINPVTSPCRKSILHPTPVPGRSHLGGKYGGNYGPGFLDRTSFLSGVHVFQPDLFATSGIYGQESVQGSRVFRVVPQISRTSYGDSVRPMGFAAQGPGPIRFGTTYGRGSAAV